MRRPLAVLLLICATYGLAGFHRLGAADPLPPGSKVLFSTGFEKAEGYVTEFDLAGQPAGPNAWRIDGSGGNGLLGKADGFDGQVAYLGFAPGTPGTNILHSLYRPINFTPATTNLQSVRFDVALQIFDSSTNAPNFDAFQWSVYNISGRRLFTVDFDNNSLEISYALEDGKYIAATNSAGKNLTFRSGDIYDLTLDIHFPINRWSASIGGMMVVKDQPITTTGATLDLGDIDAAWLPLDRLKPGDNYMIFDDYRVAAVPLLLPQLKLEISRRSGSSTYLIQGRGQAGLKYSIETSRDLKTWQTAITSTAAADGLFNYQDLSGGLVARFYRARLVP